MHTRSIDQETLTVRQRLLDWLAVAALIAVGVVWPADGAFGAQPADVRTGSLLLKAGPDAQPVEALRVATTVRASVTGNLARVHVTQEFRNDGDEWVDGLYVFPLAAGAAVDELEMQIGERRIRGEIQRKAEARAAFEQARSEGKRASLVEQERPNLFTSAVANIAPRSSITVHIAYLESIAYRDARYTLNVPLAITPRYTPGIGGTDVAGPVPAAFARLVNAQLDAGVTPERVTAQPQKVDIEIDLAPGFPLAGIRSLHHQVTTQETGHGRRVRLSGQAVPADRDFELVWTPVVAPGLYAAAFAERVEGQTYALVMLSPPEIVASHAAPREVLFIIDTSGSMEGPSIKQAKAALLQGVERLTPRDRFNIIRFSSDATSLFESPEPLEHASRSLAARFIASLAADGGTEMRGALELALAMPATEGFLRQIVFITDGAVSNEVELIELVREGVGAARLFTVGIGAAPNAHFMREVAAAGRGSHLFIADATQVRERMQDLFAKLERPALVDLEVHWPEGLTVELATAMPRDVYAGDPLVLVARVNGGPIDLLTLSGQAASGAWVRQLPIGSLSGQPGIAKLWARERIGELVRGKRFGDDEAGIEARIVELALAHHLVSDYTSLVAVDTTPARPAGTSAALRQAATAAPVGGAWAQTTGFTATATHAPLLMLAGALALMLAAIAAAIPVGGGRARCA